MPPTNIYVVKDNDDLFRIAADEYGDWTWWKPIADRNGIKNPRRLVTGQTLILPATAEEDPVPGVDVSNN